jgi:hypothetical protein
MEKDISSTFLYNDLSWKTFLSSVAKDISINNGIASWTINKKLQLSFNRQLVESDLDYINSLNFKEFSSCYVKKEDISILSKKYIIKKSKEEDIIVPMENFSLVGGKYTQIRTAINKNKDKYTILNDYNDYNDLLKLLNRWDNTSGEKKFQSRVGKNKYFFLNRFHECGICVFIYDKEDMIAFGVLSRPDSYGTSAYVLGKALCYDYRGLSEYADIVLFNKAMEMGIKNINMGGGDNSVINYKLKFPNAYSLIRYNIKATRIDDGGTYDFGL